MLAGWPDHAGAHVNLSNCLRETGDVEAALAAAEAACRLVPASAPAETTRGAALLAQKQLDQAIAAYRPALAADPQHEAAHAALDLGVPTYRFLRRYLERRPPVTLRQVDPLIRQLTLYRDLIDRHSGVPV